jgi:hypothetical protein
MCHLFYESSGLAHKKDGVARKLADIRARLRERREAARCEVAAL